MGAKFHQQLDRRLRFRNDQDFAEHIAELKVRGSLVLFGPPRAVQQNPDHILDVHEAEDMVERSLVHRNAGALRDGDHFHHVFERRVRGQRMNVRARHHNFAHLHVT